MPRSRRHRATSQYPAAGRVVFPEFAGRCGLSRAEETASVSPDVHRCSERQLAGERGDRPVVDADAAVADVLAYEAGFVGAVDADLAVAAGEGRIDGGVGG